MRSLIVVATFLAFALPLLNCGEDPTGSNGRTAEGSSCADATRLFYWGSVSPTDDEPNVGLPSANVRKPLWAEHDRVFIVSSRLAGGQVQRGLFAVSIDPQTGQYLGFEAFEFPHLILTYDYSATSGEFVICYSPDPSQFLVSRAAATPGSITLLDTLTTAEWRPWGARFASDTTVVVYARSPVTQVSGFFEFSGFDSEPDTALYEANLSMTDAFGFDVADNRIVFGVTGLRAAIYAYTFAGAEAARLIRESSGVFVSCDLLEGTDDLLLCRYYPGDQTAPPGNRIDLVDVATGDAKSLNVITEVSQGRFVLADFPSWDPSGTGFVFSSGAFDDEGGIFPRELWRKPDPR
jgi:hypothetical protein